MEDTEMTHCYQSAEALETQYGGGTIVWVYEGDDFPLPTEHFYFIPPNAELDDLALNVIGTNFPRYTVREVLVKGRTL